MPLSGRHSHNLGSQSRHDSRPCDKLAQRRADGNWLAVGDAILLGCRDAHLNNRAPARAGHRIGELLEERQVRTPAIAKGKRRVDV